MSEEIDGYIDTVRALLAYVMSFTWEGEAIRPGAVHEHGCSQEWNALGAKVTPDVALLFPGDVGSVGEVKTSFGRGGVDADKIRDKLLQYDGVMQLWKAGKEGVPPRVADGGVVLLTHHLQKNVATGYFADEVASGRFAPTNKFGIVSFIRDGQKTKVFYLLERAFGELVPARVDAELKMIKPVWLDLIESNYGDIKFYDATPPLGYLLQVLWDMLPSMAPEAEFRTRAEGGKRKTISSQVAVQVDAADLARRLRDAFGLRRLSNRIPESPKKAVVKAALEKLRAWELATRQGQDGYLVGWRPLQGGTKDYFLRKLALEIDAQSEGGGSLEQQELDLENL